MTAVDISNLPPHSRILVESSARGVPTVWGFVLDDPKLGKVTVVASAPEADENAVLLATPVHGRILGASRLPAGKIAGYTVCAGYSLHFETRGGRRITIPIMGLKIRVDAELITLIERAVSVQLWLDGQDQFTLKFMAAMNADGVNAISCGGLNWRFDEGGTPSPLRASFRCQPSVAYLPASVKGLPVMRAQLDDGSALDHLPPEAYMDGPCEASVMADEHLMKGPHYAVTVPATAVQVSAPDPTGAIAYFDRVASGKATPFVRWE